MNGAGCQKQRGERTSRRRRHRGPGELGHGELKMDTDGVTGEWAQGRRDCVSVQSPR